MLTDMAAKSKQEKNDEEIAFAKFSTWCSHESANLKADITKGKEEIEQLTAEIGKLQSDATSLGDAIGNLGNNVATFEADLKASTVQREKDHATFLADSKDYSESIDALDRAIAVLQQQNYDRQGSKAALLQVSENSRVPEEARSLISAFVSVMKDDQSTASPDAMSYEAPEANAYEFQSGGVIEILKKLRISFKQFLADCQKSEMNSKHAHDMIVQDLTDSIENAKKAIEQKSIQKERTLEDAASKKQQHSSVASAKAEDEKTLGDVTNECNEKKLSYDEKQKLREEELQAIQKAIEILKSAEVSGNANKHLSLAQVSQIATSLLQIEDRRDETDAHNSGIRLHVRQFLEGESKRLHSQQLGLLAQKLISDPFAKVKKLIDDLITRLLEEAKSDADHEGFCDTEMGKSKITRNRLTEEIDALTANVEEGKATAASLSEDIATLSKEIADLDVMMTEASAMRKEEGSTNEATIADATAAQAAVLAATAVLKEFYSKASAATAFVQVRRDPVSLLGSKRGVTMGSEEWDSLANPNFNGTVDKGHKAGMQTFGETYTGKQDEAGGVLALLEVILSDFAGLEADTKAAEDAAQKEFDELMTQSRKTKAVKSKKLEMNTSDKAAAESKLRSDTNDMKSTQDELLAAHRYYERLVPQCIDKGMTYEERTQARQQEIQSLKEALKILNGADIA